MTKKQDPFEEAEIDQDSEPLKFEEATSLFEEENPSSKKAEEIAPKEEKPEPTPEVQEPAQELVEPFPGDEDMASTIGAFLGQMREEKGINLKIISQHTKISVSNLERLEADDLDALPNRAYVIGYVKSYAKALQLNQNDCLELLDMTYGIEKEEVVQESSTPKMADGPKSVSKKSEDGDGEGQGIKIGIAVGALAIIAFLLILNNTGKKDEVNSEEVVQEEVQPEVEENKKVIPQTLGASTPLKETSSANEEILVAKTETDLKPKPLATPVPKKQLEEIKKEVKKEEVKKEEAKVVEEKIIEKKEEPKKEEKKKEEKINFKPLAKVLYQEDTGLSQDEYDRLLPTKYRAAVVEGQQNIFINAVKADSWLTYKSDDDPIKKFVLKKGRTILIRGKLIRVFLGNLGAVKVFKNNKPLTITSPSGVKSLVVPQERGSEFVIPLFIFKKNGSVQTSEDYLEENQN
ncbi:MAG: cytoskeletal protein RodZ [Bacteriovoracaceae bacterium]|jgi:cytoskeletal protein RodZ